MPEMVGYFLLFTAVGVAFILVNLTVGKLVRPAKMDAEKATIYECGEPTIGSAWVQFDLRFYVVALLFIIFDVEVAFFFPWATIYGGAMQLADKRLADTPAVQEELSAKLLNVSAAERPLAPENVISPDAAFKLGAMGLVDILVFFGVLLVGFAYVWKRGDLDWVRAVTKHAQQAPPRPKVPPLVEPRPERRPQPVSPA
jgi:NADH-quinone oxidoreductase subunit A